MCIFVIYIYKRCIYIYIQTCTHWELGNLTCDKKSSSRPTGCNMFSGKYWISILLIVLSSCYTLLYHLILWLPNTSLINAWLTHYHYSYCYSIIFYDIVIVLSRQSRYLFYWYMLKYPGFIAPAERATESFWVGQSADNWESQSIFKDVQENDIAMATHVPSIRCVYTIPCGYLT
jgi:hypothetical protein